MYSKKIKREATEGEVLYRWLRGVKAKALTPLFLIINWYRTSLLSGGKLPSGSYYPIADKTKNIKTCKNHRVARPIPDVYPFNT
jgi:hypothetical protein